VVPLPPQVRDQARRFITLVDELYNSRARLVCSAAAAPDRLFAGAGGGEEPIVDLESLQVGRGSNLDGWGRGAVSAWVQRQRMKIISGRPASSWHWQGRGAGAASKRAWKPARHACLEQPLLSTAGAWSCPPCAQFETAVEGSRLRRDLTADGGVAPVAATAAEAAAAARRLGGEEERFAFARAVSRLYEMQTPLYLASRPRLP
jgi:predicted ATPase